MVKVNSQATTPNFCTTLSTKAQATGSAVKKFAINWCSKLGQLIARIKNFITTNFHKLVQYVKTNPEVAKKGVIVATVLLAVGVVSTYAYKCFGGKSEEAQKPSEPKQEEAPAKV